VLRLFRARTNEESATVIHSRFQFTLIGFAGFLLVVAMALAPLSSGVNALGAAAYMAAVGILGLAALSGRGKDRTFRLAFAASGAVFLLVSGWFSKPGVVGQPDVGRIFQAVSAIVFGILGGLLARRWTVARGTKRVRAAPPQTAP
jgi:hypothetical protein